MSKNDALKFKTTLVDSKYDYDIKQFGSWRDWLVFFKTVPFLLLVVLPLVLIVGGLVTDGLTISVLIVTFLAFLPIGMYIAMVYNTIVMERGSRKAAAEIEDYRIERHKSLGRYGNA